MVQMTIDSIMKYDLHMHSKYSPDSTISPKEMVKIAIKKGFDGIAITDHNTIKGGIKAKEYETENFKIIVGSEIMTNRGEVIGLFLKEEIEKYKDFHDVVTQIKDQNGIVIIPHPFDRLRRGSLLPTYDNLKEDIKFIDCIEVFNSRCLLKRYNEKALEFGKRHGIINTAGSDTHFANEIGNAGVITDNEDLREAFKKGQLKIFGNKTMIMNHVFSKIYRFKKEYTQYFFDI